MERGLARTVMLVIVAAVAAAATPAHAAQEDRGSPVSGRQSGDSAVVAELTFSEPLSVSALRSELRRLGLLRLRDCS